MRALLEVADVSVRFDGVTALDSVSFAVAHGELVGLIGPNGAGKTTCLRVVTGVVRPAQGCVRLDGADLTGLATHARVRRGLGLSQQLVRPFRSMTAVENVTLAAGAARTRRPLAALFQHDRARERRRAHELLDLVGIADAADHPPSSLPLGHLKRLEVARALAVDPRLLLLDEPLAGLNHLEARAMADTIARLRRSSPDREALTIVLIEHNLGEMLRVCERLVVLDNGRRIADGAPAAVMRDPAVRAAYVGREADDAAA
jgi:branched-chain amino acid transport system ATP-binding protein